MLKILLVCGHASAIQGWGNMETTYKIQAALKAAGHSVNIFFAETNKELEEHLANNSYDLVWSSIYYFTKAEKYINDLTKLICVSDILEQMNIPYVGSSAQTLKNMIDKRKTLDILNCHNIETHQQYIIPVDGKCETLDFLEHLWFVKPCFESESNGVDEGSIVHNMDELRRRIHYVWDKFHQSALVEEYLSGDEYTVAMIGNDENQIIMPIKNVIATDAYNKYPIITQNLKVDKKLTFEIPYSDMEALKILSLQTKQAIGFCDHVRIDIRKDIKGELKVIEVNGIPGLNPIKSRIFEIYNIYHEENTKESNYIGLVNEVVEAAYKRVYAMQGREDKGGNYVAL